MVGAHDSDFDSPGYLDAFVAKFSPKGKALWITYLGGHYTDIGYGIAVHPGTGYSYVVGETSSVDFPTTSGVLQPADPNASFFSDGSIASNGGDAFVSVFDPTGAMVASTYLGHVGVLFPANSHAQGVGVDANGRIYVSGVTSANSFPTLNAFQATKPSSYQSAFLTALAPGATNLVYSTYFGGDGREDEARVAVDWAGNATLAGLTWYLGGRGHEFALGIAVDAQDNAYVTGRLDSGDFPLFAPLQLAGLIFLAKLDPGHSLLFSTPLGGSLQDYGTAITVDGNGNAYVAGVTSSSDFPVRNAFQASLQCCPPGGPFGGHDAFVMKIDTSNNNAGLVMRALAAPLPVSLGANVTYTIAVTNNGPSIATHLEVSYNGSSGQQVAGSFASTLSSGSCTTTAVASGLCDIGILGVGDAATITISGMTTAVGPISIFAVATAAEPDPTTPNNTTASTTVVDTVSVVVGSGGSATTDAEGDGATRFLAQGRPELRRGASAARPSGDPVFPALAR